LARNRYHLLRLPILEVAFTLIEATDRKSRRFLLPFPIGDDYIYE
jgi:hypothetical protein